MTTRRDESKKAGKLKVTKRTLRDLPPPADEQRQARGGWSIVAASRKTLAKATTSATASFSN